MRVYVEPSPAGGWCVRAEGVDAPVSRHDTEEDARERAAAYARGLMREAAERPQPDPGRRVRLRDGSEVLIREVRPEDKPLFEAAFERLGDRSRYQRFMGFHDRLTESELRYLTELDHEDHDAIVALDPATGELLGVARAVRLPDDRGVAEAAITIIDAWQSRGLGHELLRRLSRRAAARGVRRFRAALLTSNRAVLGLFKGLGKVEVVRQDGVAMEIDVEWDVGDGDALSQALRAAEGEISAR